MARPRTDIAPRILEAGRRRFVQEGVEGASLRNIAKDAGTSIGMIYYYYPTKDDLFEAIIETTYSPFLAELRTLAEAEGDLRRRLLALSERVFHMTKVEGEVARLILAEAMNQSPRFRKVFARFREGHLALVFGAVKEAQALGEVTSLVPPLLLTVLSLGALGPGQFAARQLKASPLGAALPDLDRLPEALVNALFDGLAPR